MAKLIEAVAAQIKARLEAELAAKITTINAEVTDFDLQGIGEFIDGERQALVYPALWVLGATSAHETPEENQNEYFSLFPLGLWLHEIEIVIAVTDADEPGQLKKRLYRYVRAVCEVVKDNESYVAGVSDWIRARVSAASYTRVFQHAGSNAFRQDVFVFVEVLRAD